MKTLDKKAIEKEAIIWKSLKTLLEATPAKQCHK
jgi:hypothetical protein